MEKTVVQFAIQTVVLTLFIETVIEFQYAFPENKDILLPDLTVTTT